jgi:enoyl-[acyl-carrier protein] reductase I
VRFLAAYLAARRVHVHAISAGAVKTRAASGLDHFDVLLDEAHARTPAQHLVTIKEIGRIAAVLASDVGMTLIGSTIFYADAGFHVVA